MSSFFLFREGGRKLESSDTGAFLGLHRLEEGCRKYQINSNKTCNLHQFYCRLSYKKEKLFRGRDPHSTIIMSSTIISRVHSYDDYLRKKHQTTFNNLNCNVEIKHNIVDLKSVVAKHKTFLSSFTLATLLVTGTQLSH